MGISVEEYLAKKAACADCIAHGDEDHCVSTLLSREDNCLFYNIILAYHLPDRNKTQAFTPDEMTSVAVQREFALLKSLRDKIKEEKVVEYYVRAQNIVTMIKGIHQNDRLIWAGYYDRYVTDILKDIKDGKDEDAVTKMYIMIEELENTNGRVICTWLVKNGMMSKTDLDVDHMFTVKNIDFNTRLGYLFWAVPMVESLDSMIKRNSVLDRVAITLVQKLAQARANEVKYCMGYADHTDLLGKFVRFFGEGFCYLLGFLLKNTTVQKSKTNLG
jgi:hypothetical protein